MTGSLIWTTTMFPYDACEVTLMCLSLFMTFKATRELPAKINVLKKFSIHAQSDHGPECGADTVCLSQPGQQ